MMIFADAGLPLIVAWPFTFALLLPIIAIEFFAARLPSEIGVFRKLWAIGVANVASTLVGWPLAWLILVLLQLFVVPGGQSPYGLDTTLGVLLSVTVQSPWLIPYGEQYLQWMVPAAITFLMIPFLWVSVITEGWIIRLCLPELAASQRKSSVWCSNLWSYTFLIVCSLIWLASALHSSHALPRG